MRARVPASTANLGPGFDTLALALSLYIEVEIVAAKKFSIMASGEGAEDASLDQDHPAAALAIKIRGDDKFAMKVHSELPVSRGLGSSAALAAAVAAACGSEDPFRIAADYDGHPENAAASVFGGFIAAANLAHGPVVRRLPLDPELYVIAVVPKAELKTHEARAILPESVSFADAVFNISRMPLLLSGMADIAQLTPAATEDRLHQPYRQSLFPEADAVLHALVAAGALAAAWSGAGRSLIGFCGREQAKSVSKATKENVGSLGLEADVLTLAPDVAGLAVE